MGELLVEKSRAFWGRQIAWIVGKYGVDSDDRWLALANGAYAWALGDYARFLPDFDAERDQYKLQEDISNGLRELNKNSTEGGNVDAGMFFPFLRGTCFKAAERTDNEGSVWWRGAAAPFGDVQQVQYSPLYLPDRAEYCFAEGADEFCITFSLVPFNLGAGEAGGDFSMLSLSECVSPFYLAAHEINGRQLAAFRKMSGDSDVGDSALPCMDGSVNEAIEYCNWLSVHDGLTPVYKKSGEGWTVNLLRTGYRLPFDYEWEYAARFGYDFFKKAGAPSWKELEKELGKDGSAPGETTGILLLEGYSA